MSKEIIKKFKKYKSIVMVIWKDAAYSYRSRLPKKLPTDQITFGIFLGSNKDAINIGMNCHMHPETHKIIDCKDAFLIPKKVIN